MKKIPHFILKLQTNKQKQANKQKPSNKTEQKLLLSSYINVLEPSALFSITVALAVV